MPARSIGCGRAVGAGPIDAVGRRCAARDRMTPRHRCGAPGEDLRAKASRCARSALGALRGQYRHPRSAVAAVPPRVAGCGVADRRGRKLHQNVGAPARPFGSNGPCGAARRSTYRCSSSAIPAGGAPGVPYANDRMNAAAPRRAVLLGCGEVLSVPMGVPSRLAGRNGAAVPGARREGSSSYAAGDLRSVRHGPHRNRAVGALHRCGGTASFRVGAFFAGLGHSIGPSFGVG